MFLSLGTNTETSVDCRVSGEPLHGFSRLVLDGIWLIQLRCAEIMDWVNIVVYVSSIFEPGPSDCKHLLIGMFYLYPRNLYDRNELYFLSEF